jgi:hypothetical protein
MHFLHQINVFLLYNEIKMALEDNKVAKKKIESYDISKSDETMHLATDLAKFIRENKLFLNIQGKEYVNVEGWQYAGARLGILPVVEQLINISDDKEVKYQAKVNLLNLRTEQVVGTGFAICSNKEAGKKYYQEFAIASMAQTRAIGKAYRNILAWIIRAAGYEPTPAEEMDYVTHPAGREEHKEAATPQAQKQQAKPTAIKEEAPAEEQTVPKAAMASSKLKAEILLLLSNKVITDEEKEKMVMNINKLDAVRAEKVLEKLKKVIQERGASDSIAA